MILFSFLEKITVFSFAAITFVFLMTLLIYYLSKKIKTAIKEMNTCPKCSSEKIKIIEPVRIYTDGDDEYFYLKHKCLACKNIFIA